jgi:hypothetical protein
VLLGVCGWDSFVCFEALCAFYVYLEALALFDIYILLIKKKKNYSLMENRNYHPHNLVKVLLMVIG